MLTGSSVGGCPAGAGGVTTLGDRFCAQAGEIPVMHATATNAKMSFAIPILYVNPL
jgi:hypothetical protein